MTSEATFFTHVSTSLGAPARKLLGTTALACISAAAALVAVAFGPALAADSTWLELAIDDNYNDVINWSPNAAPVNQGDTAFFGQSNTTNLTITAPVNVDSWVFNADADNYTFTSDQDLNFFGDGIVVDGGSVGFTNALGGVVGFWGASSAGNAAITNHSTLDFLLASTAGNSTILNNGVLNFNNSSTAANATITTTSLGTTNFYGISSAGDAAFIVDNGGTLRFFGGTAANATITNNGVLNFFFDSTAGDAFINNNNNTEFFDSSSAGSAQITNSAGGVLIFGDASSAGSSSILNEAFSFAVFFEGTSSAGNASIVNHDNILFQSSSAAGSATILNQNGADLTFSQNSSAGNATIENAMTGDVFFTGTSTAGTATLTNRGTLRFLADSTASGATIFNESLLRLEDNASLGDARVVNAAGAVTEINPLAAASTTVGSIEGAGDINLGNKGLFTGLNGLSTEVSGVLSGVGGALVKVGEGTLALSGVNTYTGVTQVINGALIVNGSIASSSTVAVNPGATLGGTGVVATTGVGADGTIAPGNSIGTLNVAGDITFGAGSIYEIEVNSAGQSDLIDATGIATLNGIAEVVPFPDFALDTQYTILTAAGGVGGTFDNVGFGSGSLFLTPSLTYGANDVFLNIAQTAGFVSAALTPNQIAAAGGAQSLGGGPLFTAISLLGDVGEARAAFDAISGEIHASAKTALIEDSRYLREAANDRIRTAFAAADDDGTGAWARGFGAIGHIDSDGNAAALDRNLGGLFVGADAEAFDNWVFGALAGYSRSGFNVGDRASSGSASSYHLGAYGGGEWENFALRLGGAYSWHTIGINRTAAFTGFSDSLSSTYSAGTAQLFGEFGYKMKVQGADIEPFANAAWVSHSTSGPVEAGGAAALTGTADTLNTTFTTLGVRASKEFATGEGRKFELSGMAGWRHAFGAGVPTSTLAFAGGSPFTVAGVPIARDALVLDAGITAAIAPTSTLGVSYSGQIASGASSHSFRADLGVRF